MNRTALPSARQQQPVFTGRTELVMLDVSVLDAQRRFRIAQMYAGMLTLAILGYTLNLLFDLVYRCLLGWHWGMLRRKE